MASDRITVVVVHEGRLEKAFSVTANSRVSTLIARIKDHVCVCSKNGIFLVANGEKLTEEELITRRGISDGDIVNVRILPSWHLRRDMVVEEDKALKYSSCHYVEPETFEVAGYVLPKRITIKSQESFGMEMALSVRDNRVLSDMLEAFAKLVRKDRGRLRFEHEGTEVDAKKTAREADIKDDDIIKALYKPRPAT